MWATVQDEHHREHYTWAVSSYKNVGKLFDNEQEWEVNIEMIIIRGLHSSPSSQTELRYSYNYQLLVFIVLVGLLEKCRNSLSSSVKVYPIIIEVKQGFEFCLWHIVRKSMSILTYLTMGSKFSLLPSGCCYALHVKGILIIYYTIQLLKSSVYFNAFFTAL